MPTAAPEAALSTESYARLGGITRELHEALTKLGAVPELARVVQEIPDARDRLTYVGKMTEDAANKVLGLVEGAKPGCSEVASRGVELADAIDRLAASPDMSVERARALMKLCGDYARRSASFAGGHKAVLNDIMMAQDFQDLSGQVIKKVIDIITRTERQLVQLLVDSAPEQLASQHDAALQGPQVPDKALKQDEVDDLLASLGF